MMIYFGDRLLCKPCIISFRAKKNKWDRTSFFTKAGAYGSTDCKIIYSPEKNKNAVLREFGRKKGCTPKNTPF
jgi:hypothetical protein